MRGEKSNIGYWDNAADSVSWQVRFDAPGTYEVSAQVATIHDNTRFRLELDDQFTDVKVEKSADWADFREVPCGRLTIKNAGRHELRIRAADAANWKPINLAGLNIKPAH
jgi:alpha-L-fucosidase